EGLRYQHFDGQSHALGVGSVWIDGKQFANLAPAPVQCVVNRAFVRQVGKQHNGLKQVGLAHTVRANEYLKREQICGETVKGFESVYFNSCNHGYLDLLSAIPPQIYAMLPGFSK